MSQELEHVEALLDNLWLDLPGVCRLAGVSEVGLQERIGLGLLASPASGPGHPGRVDGAGLRRVRRIAALERDLPGCRPFSCRCLPGSGRG